jgi:hypothetical protein
MEGRGLAEKTTKRIRGNCATLTTMITDGTSDCRCVSLSKVGRRVFKEPILVDLTETSGVSNKVRSCSSYVVTQKGESYSRTSNYTLKRKFTERYNFLLEASRRKGKKKQQHSRVPALNFKEGGVLQTFLNLTPEGSRESFKVAVPLVDKRFS